MDAVQLRCRHVVYCAIAVPSISIQSALILCCDTLLTGCLVAIVTQCSRSFTAAISCVSAIFFLYTCMRWWACYGACDILFSERLFSCFFLIRLLLFTNKIKIYSYVSNIVKERHRVISEGNNWHGNFYENHVGIQKLHVFNNINIQIQSNLMKGKL